MRTTTVTVFLSCLALGSAFKLTGYKIGGVSCSPGVGETPKEIKSFKLEDGCQKLSDIAKDVGGFGIEWSDETDNDYLLVPFEDENCCNGAAHDGWGWKDKCQSLGGYGSVRVVDPKDINKGKSGQKYDCVGSLKAL